jgi:hypothetical protein
MLRLHGRRRRSSCQIRSDCLCTLVSTIPVWASAPRKTPAGVEPARSCFAGSRPTVRLQRHDDRVHGKCPRQELNLVFDLRRVACDPPHSEDVVSLLFGCRIGQIPRQGVEPRLAVPKTAVRPSHSPGNNNSTVSRPGVEPEPRPSEGRMRSITPSGRLRSGIPAGTRTSRSPKTRILFCPKHDRDKRADDWICTSIRRFTRAVPRCSATSASSTGARSRTLSGGFGDRLLSQEHAGSSAPGRQAAGVGRND